MRTRSYRALAWRRIDSTCGGFTLIELLTVMAIIGILVAILIPTVRSARISASKAKTRAQFSQWAAAFESFRQEYGTYPQLYPQGAQKLVNQNATAVPTAEHLFHDVLTGQRREASANNWVANRPSRNPPFAETQNPRRIRFYSFSESEFVTQADVTAGRNTAGQLHQIRDAFNNVSIAVITDTNLDGVINARDSTGGFPGVAPPSGGTALRPPAADLPTANTGGVRAGVIFYSAPPNPAADGGDLIKSWK